MLCSLRLHARRQPAMRLHAQAREARSGKDARREYFRLSARRGSQDTRTRRVRKMQAQR